MVEKKKGRWCHSAKYCLLLPVVLEVLKMEFKQELYCASDRPFLQGLQFSTFLANEWH